MEKAADKATAPDQDASTDALSRDRKALTIKVGHGSRPVSSAHHQSLCEARAAGTSSALTDHPACGALTC